MQSSKGKVVIIAAIITATGAVLAALLGGPWAKVITIDPLNVELSEQIDSSLSIRLPRDGGEVSLKEIVSGKTPYPEKNHYLVVTPVEVGDPYIQRTPIQISKSGQWTGFAQFGSHTVGIGEVFLLSIIATNETLTQENLQFKMGLGMDSSHIRVIRKS